MGNCLPLSQTSKRVVLLGFQGHGKSNLLAVARGVSPEYFTSAGATAGTRCCQYVHDPKFELEIVDMPGTDPETPDEVIEHNLWVKKALTSAPVAAIILVVKAEHRFQQMSKYVKHFLSKLSEYPEVKSLVTPCFTHMDQICVRDGEGKWLHPKSAEQPDMIFVDQDSLTKKWQDWSDSESVPIFMGFDAKTSAKVQSVHLKTAFKRACKTPLRVQVSTKDFLKWIKRPSDEPLDDFTHPHEQQVVQCALGQYKWILGEFDKELKRRSGMERLNLAFDFHAFAKIQLEEYRKAVVEALEFDTSEWGRVDSRKGHFNPKAAIEVSVIADLSCQLAAMLAGVSKQLFALQDNADVNQLPLTEDGDPFDGDALSSRSEGGFRRCPHCHQVWALVEGCHGETYCGDVPEVRDDAYGDRSGVVHCGSYCFKLKKAEGAPWSQLDDLHPKAGCPLLPAIERLEVVRYEKQINTKITGDNEASFIGCGQSIAWDQMQKVDFSEILETWVPTVPIGLVCNGDEHALESLEGSLNAHMDRQEMLDVEQVLAHGHYFEVGQVYLKILRRELMLQVSPTNLREVLVGLSSLSIDEDGLFQLLRDQAQYWDDDDLWTHHSLTRTLLIPGLIIHSYTMEGIFSKVSSVLNNCAKREDQSISRPLRAWEKSIILSLQCLPASLDFVGCKEKLLFRGIKFRFPEWYARVNFRPGNEIFWYTLKSCTSEPELMRSPEFCGFEGYRTVLRIADGRGKRISAFSAFPDEDEILVAPGAKFLVLKFTRGSQENGDPFTTADIIDLQMLDHTPIVTLPDNFLFDNTL